MAIIKPSKKTVPAGPMLTKKKLLKEDFKMEKKFRRSLIGFASAVAFIVIAMLFLI